MAYSQVNKQQEIEGYELRTMTGDIVSFTPSYSEPLPEPFSNLNVKCSINPVQDLHGYDHPWPAGSGKNQLNYDEWKKSGFIRASGVWENNGVTITATENDGYTQYNEPAFSAKVPVSVGDDIYISWQEDTNKNGMVYLFTSRNGALGARAYVNNNYAKSLHYVVTAEDEGYISFRFGVTNQGETISYKNIQIEKGSIATPYEPYENVCPISGFDELNIKQSGQDMTEIAKLIKLEFDDTVYLAEVSCLNGVWKLKLLGAEYVVDSAAKIYRNTGNSWYADPTNGKHYATAQETVMSDKFAQGQAQNQNVCFMHPNGLIRFNTAKSYDTARDLLADIGTFTFVYPLETPTEITLDETEQFEALLGVNNVWHDGNGNTEVTCLI